MPATISPPLRIQPLLRPAEPKDVPAIIALGRKTFTATFGHSCSPSDLNAYLSSAYSPSAILESIINPEEHMIVAVSSFPSHSDHILGFVNLHTTSSSSEPCMDNADAPIEFQKFYVDLEAHGMGIGRRLSDNAEEWAKEKGYKTVWLGVWEENEKAQKVYKRFGYERVGNHNFALGECIQTDWIMQKSL